MFGNYDVNPHLGATNCKFDVSLNDIGLADSYAKTKSVFGCSDEFEKLALTLMAHEDLEFPKNATDARILYDCLLRLIENI